MGKPRQPSEELSLRSAVAVELQRLGPKRRARLQLSDGLVALAETVFLVAEGYGSGDPEWWDHTWTSVENVFAAYQLADDEDPFGAAELDPPAWLRTSGAGAKHVQRVIGAAAAARLTQALDRDLEVVAPALQTGLRDLLPLARAFDLCTGGIGTLPAELAAMRDQRTTDWVIQLDRVVGKRVLSQLGADGGQGAEVRFGTLSDLMPALGPAAEASILLLLDEIESPLRRKLSGARQVLGVSSDDVSQCAHSLVEFTDRLLRSAYPSNEVLAWVDAYLPDRGAEMVYETDGRQRPTKFAEMLCFLHAGSAVPDNYSIAEVAARAAVSARTELQGLKHADAARPEDRDRLDEQFEVLEASLLLAFKMSWRVAPEEALTALKERLSDAA